VSGRKPIAGLALTCGLGIEILDAVDVDDRVVWRWSDETKEHRSKLVDGAFRTGQVWRRLADFTPYERYRNEL
jgi:hypothetical protein